MFVPSHYKLPLSVVGSYVYDANHKMMCMRHPQSQQWVARGWGHIQYKEDGARTMDLWCASVYDAFTSNTSMSDVVSTLTAAMTQAPENVDVDSLLKLRDMVRALSSEIDQQHCTDDMLDAYSRFLTQAEKLCG